MAKITTKTPVKGGTIVRDASTGRLVAVRSDTATSRPSPKTLKAVEKATAKRKDALQRLANR